MKTIKLFVPLLSLLIGFTTATAYTKPADDGIYTKTHAINEYVDAVTRGKLDGFDDVLDASVKFTTLRKDKKLVSYTKAEMMGFLKKIRNIEENCTTSTAIIENAPDMIVVKVDMQFEGFTRSNYVSIANTGNGWKIINVYSVFN
jgi:hypothetical protein